MAYNLASRPREARSENKERCTLNIMSRYRLDPTRIEMGDTRARGGQGLVIVGTLTLPGALNIPLPRIMEKLYPKCFETLLCNESNELQLEAVEELFVRYSPKSVFEAFKGLQAEASKEDISGKLKETVFQALKEMIFGKKVAVKMLKWPCDDVGKFFKSFVNELSLMASLSHPNIIEFLGFVEDMNKGHAWIILPWEANGNVREFLQSQSGEWDIPERISLIQDVAKGLEYLHSRDSPICHGDLKSLNILVNSSFRAVITDFGSARIRRSVASGKKENQEEMFRPVQTTDEISAESTSPLVKFDTSTSDLTLTGPAFSLRWTAPEVLDNGVPDLPSDMWAMGWICWEIITGKMPFEELHRGTAIIYHTMAGKLPPIRQDDQLSHVLMLCSLMSDCWRSDPEKRIVVFTFQQKAANMPSAVPSASAADGQNVRSAGLLIELGRMYELQSKREEAQTQYLEAISIATQTKDDFAKASALQCLGRIHATNSNFEKAVQSYEQAREIYSRMDNSLGTANALVGLGEVYRLQSKHPEAENAFTEACILHSSIENDIGTGNAFFGLGNTFQAQSRTQEAETAFSEARGIHSRIGNDLGVGNALVSLGNTYVVQLRNQEAEMAFMEAYEIHDRIGNRLGTASALDGLGELYRVEFKHQEAEKAFRDAHEIHCDIGNDLGTGNALVGLGNTYLAQSRSREAEKAFMDAHQIHSRIGNGSGAANALDGLGELYRAEAKHREAEKAFRDALAIHSRIGNDLGEGNALLGLGNTYLAQSRNQEAEKAFEEARQIHSRIKNDMGLASALVGLEQVQDARLQDQEVKNACDDAPSTHSLIADSLGAGNASLSHEILHGDQLARIETELCHRHALAPNDCANKSHRSIRTPSNIVPGKLHHIQNRYLETEEAATKALAIATSSAYRQGQAATSQLLARMLQSQLPRSEALDGLIQEEAMYARTGDHMRRARTWDRIGDVFLAQGEYAKAEEPYQFAQAIYSSISCADGEGETLRDRGWLYIHQGRHAEAEECLIQARLTFASAIIPNEYGEARALDGLTVVHALQGRFGDAKFACVEAREIYTRLGRPISDICTYLSTLLRVLEENPDLMSLYESLQA